MPLIPKWNHFHYFGPCYSFRNSCTQKLPVVFIPLKTSGIDILKKQWLFSILTVGTFYPKPGLWFLGVYLTAFVLSTIGTVHFHFLHTFGIYPSPIQSTSPDFPLWSSFLRLVVSLPVWQSTSFRLLAFSSLTYSVVLEDHFNRGFRVICEENPEVASQPLLIAAWAWKSEILS